PCRDACSSHSACPVEPAGCDQLPVGNRHGMDSSPDILAGCITPFQPCLTIPFGDPSRGDSTGELKPAADDKSAFVNLQDIYIIIGSVVLGRPHGGPGRAIPLSDVMCIDTA